MALSPFIVRLVHSRPFLQVFYLKTKVVARIVASKLRGGPDFGGCKHDEEFLFIVGCGRSGNTLLRRLLMERFDIYIPPETYVLARQIEYFYFYQGLRWPEKVDGVLSMLENHEEFVTFGVESLGGFREEARKFPGSERNFVSLITNLYRWLGQVHGIESRWVGDKTPLNTLNLGVIGRALPSAKYIYLERDPVDVVQSYLDSGIYRSARMAALRWRTSLMAWGRFKKGLEGADFLEVKYEHLVSSPGKVLNEIGHKFGIPERVDERLFVPSELGDVGLRSHHSNVGNKPTTSSIGKGRKKISSDDLKAARKVLRALPERRGYGSV